MNVKTAAAPVKEQWAGARAALSLTSLSIFSSENSSQADCMWAGGILGDSQEMYGRILQQQMCQQCFTSS